MRIDVYDEYEDYNEFVEDMAGAEWIELYNFAIFNKYTTPSQLQGTYNTHMYIFIAYPNNCFLYPLLYSDVNNKPKQLLNYSCTPGYPLEGVNRPSPYTTDFTERWVHSTMTVNNSIAEGIDVWFGYFGNSVVSRFDYGAPLCQLEPPALDYDYTAHYGSVRQMLESRSYLDIGSLQDRYVDPGSDDYNILRGARYDMKVSMYLEINTAVYIRSLTQGARVTDNRKQTGTYQRSATQTARGTAETKGFVGFYRRVVQAVTNAMTVKGPRSLARKLAQQAGTGAVFGRLLSMLRIPAQTAGTKSGTQRITQAKRAIANTGKPGTTISRKQNFKRGIAHGGNVKAATLWSAGYAKRFQETAGTATYTGVARTVAIRLIVAVAALYETKARGGFNRGIGDIIGIGSMLGKTALFFRALFGVADGADGAGSFIGRMRVIEDTENAVDEMGHATDYLRGLFVEAGNIAEPTHRGTYYRTQQDTARSEGVALRHLFVFLRLLTGAYIRDYIIGRFLKSNEELIIKSPVCREITLDSAIH